MLRKALPASVRKSVHGWRMFFLKGNVATGFKRAIAEILWHISRAITKIASEARIGLNSDL